MFTRRKSLLEIDQILHNKIKYNQGNFIIFKKRSFILSNNSSSNNIKPQDYLSKS